MSVLTNNMEEKSLPEKHYDLLEKRPPNKTCPYCGSFYLTDLQCEACGHLLNKHFLGRPYGPSSYYVINGKFWDERHPIFKVLPMPHFLPQHLWQRYRLRLMKRLMSLFQYFLIDDEELMESDERGHFFVELEDLVRELSFFGQTMAPLIERLEIVALKLRQKGAILIEGQEELLMEKIGEIYRQRQGPRTLWQWFISYRLGGVFEVGFLFPVMIFIALFCWFAILLFQKLLTY